jgi:hypothetical protein
MEDLLVVLAKHKAGETVKIEYRRAGRYAETTAELKPLAGAPPPPGNPPDKAP